MISQIYKCWCEGVDVEKAAEQTGESIDVVLELYTNWTTNQQEWLNEKP